MGQCLHPAMPSVLIAEDDVDQRSVLTSYLCQVGFEVICCPSGRHAITVLEEVSVDVLLTDLHMPEVPGLDLLAWTKEHRPQTRLVVMSGDLSEPVRDQCHALGAESCLQKPLEFGALAKLLLGAE